jgi:hypothetical protein
MNSFLYFYTIVKDMNPKPPSTRKKRSVNPDLRVIVSYPHNVNNFIWIIQIFFVMELCSE